ncbi:uncharacterized protein LOC126981520 [Eriocheir sinensis]|uniref:uncharacterized protein LOC126981520 n=1 Tax=Eriocheir sinensis TaxID=95602 RepID=UPI0021C8A397|nr:uncharacterized protein LOC126981520 [Eriocheir sinensis]
MTTPRTVTRMALYCFVTAGVFLLATLQRQRPPQPTSPASLFFSLTFRPSIPTSFLSSSTSFPISKDSISTSQEPLPVSANPMSSSSSLLVTQDYHTPQSHVPECQDMFTIKKSENTIWDTDKYYWDLSRLLSPLLQDISLTSGEISAFPGTRLELMNGSLPYLPCTVREYPAEEVGRCLAARRRARRLPTWLAFYGDSNMRQKMMVVVHSFLPPDLSYRYFLNDSQVTRDSFEKEMNHETSQRPTTFDVIGCRGTDERNLQEDDDNGGGSDSDGSPSQTHGKRNPTPPDAHETTTKPETLPRKPPPLLVHHVTHYEVRVTLVWATKGSTSGDDEAPTVTRLEEWSTRETVPDVLVVGFGKWFMNTFEQELSPFTYAATTARLLLPPLARLERRTVVVQWTQSRLRRYNFMISRVAVNVSRMAWHLVLLNEPFNYGLALLDGWLHHTLGPAGVWLWDSTLPLNMANVRECETLMDANLTHHSLYTGRWWQCVDAHHASFETNTSEMTMLWNLLCNPYMNTGRPFCCAKEEN